MMRALYPYILCAVLALGGKPVSAQIEVFLGPGFGTNLNKQKVESELKQYQLMPRNQDYKIDLGVYSGKHFYFNASFNVYQQDIFTKNTDPVYPSNGTANTSYTNTYYTYTSTYRYNGFSWVPGYMAGNKVKFFAGAGLNLDFSHIKGNTVHINQDTYRYDDAGDFVMGERTSIDTSNQLIQKRGSDFSFIVQTGILLRVWKPISVQVNAYYRRSLALNSLEAEDDYKRNIGLSVSLMYRIWSNTREEKPVTE